MGTIRSTKSSPGCFKGVSDASKSSTTPTRICHLTKSGTLWVKMLPMPRHGELFAELVLWSTPNGVSGALGCATQPRPCKHMSPGPKNHVRAGGRGRRHPTRPILRGPGANHRSRRDTIITILKPDSGHAKGGPHHTRYTMTCSHTPRRLAPPPTNTLGANSLKYY